MGTKNNNSLFFTCSLIEYIGRKVKRTRKEVTDYLGKDEINRIYDYAENEISYGTFDNVKECKYAVPDYWSVGEVYERLIEDCYSDGKILDGIWEVYHSWIDAHISDYNTDFYYQPRDYIAVCYEEGRVI